MCFKNQAHRCLTLQCSFNPFTERTSLPVEARQEKLVSPPHSSANNSCVLDKPAFKNLRHQEPWQRSLTHNIRQLQQNRSHFFCHSKAKTQSEWVFWLSYRGWRAAGSPRADLLLSNHCTLSRPLRRVRGSLWLQDNFPQQTRSITATKCDSFVMGTAQHCPKYSFEVDGTARLAFKTNSSAPEPSRGSLLN